MVKFIIDSLTISETPDGWQNLTRTLKYDRTLKTLFESCEGTFTFTSDGYSYLRSQFEQYGYNKDHTCTILKFSHTDGQYKEIFEGTIKQRDIEYTLGIGGTAAKAKVEDNSLFALIYNNRNLKFSPISGKTKSGIFNFVFAGTSLPIKTNLFNPTTGSFFSPTFPDYTSYAALGFREADLLHFAVWFMTDRKVLLEPTNFFNNPTHPASNNIIFSGRMLRFYQDWINNGCNLATFSQDMPMMSFSELFSELNKVYNLSIHIYRNGVQPMMNIYQSDQLFTGITSHYLGTVDSATQKAASEYIYGKIIGGSEIITNEPTFTDFPALVPFTGFKDEEFCIDTQGNVDRDLNLRNSWIIDSNTIQDLVMNGVGTSTGYTAPTSYDQTWCMIKCENFSLSGSPAQRKVDATATNWITPTATPPYFYNEAYTTKEKALNHYGAVPASIVNYLSFGDVRFNAYAANGTPADTTGTPFAIIEPYPFNAETNDPSNLFDTTTYEYSVPATGQYTVRVKFDFTLQGAVTGFGYTPQLIIQVNSYTGGVLSNSNTIYSGTPLLYSGDSLTVDVSQIISGFAGDTFRVKVQYTATSVYSTFIISPNALFECTATSANGGSFQVYNASDYPVIRHRLEAVMTEDQYNGLIARPFDLVTYDVMDKTYSGWLEECRYDIDGLAKITLISDSNKIR